MTLNKDPHALGGIIHTYQKYDPKNFPSPTQPPPDLVSPAFEHLLAYGSLRELTDEELARAIHLDPSQIAGLGPSLEALDGACCDERKRKILEKYETDKVQKTARKTYRDGRRTICKPPAELEKRLTSERSRKSKFATWSGCGISAERRPLAVRPRSSCSWSRGWATSIRSTNWPANTSSPAARR